VLLVQLVPPPILFDAINGCRTDHQLFKGI
jgi:hypothetical protein